MSNDELITAKRPSAERAAASVAEMFDEFKNLGLNDEGKAQLAKLVERRLRRFWPV